MWMLKAKIGMLGQLRYDSLVFLENFLVGPFFTEVETEVE